MSTSILIPLEAFGIGFVISIAIAFLMKGMMDVICWASEKKTPQQHQ